MKKYRKISIDEDTYQALQRHAERLSRQGNIEMTVPKVVKLLATMKVELTHELKGKL